jgi:hypothetical protein
MASRFPQPSRARRSPRAVIAINAEHGVTWIHSYMTPDKRQTFCVYDGPSPEGIRRVAERNGLPVNKITEVSVLNPYFTV